MQIKTVGTEVEGWAGKWVDGTFVPVDITPLAQKYKKTNGYDTCGAFSTEPGPGSFEIAAMYGPSAKVAAENARRMHEIAVKEGYEIVYKMKSPFYAEPFIDPEHMKKSRYRALFGAAKRELRALGLSDADVLERQSRMGYLNVRAATHVQLGFGPGTITVDHIDSRILFLLGVLNHLGPRFARIYCQAFGIDNAGHLGITWGWGDPKRFCRPDIWFADFEDFRDQFQSLKRMMRPVGKADPDFGKWDIDLKTNMVWGEPADYKTGYWPHVRPRVEFDAIETRLLPSWPIHHLEEMMQGLVEWVNFLLDIAPARSYRSLEEFKQSETWRKVAARPILGRRIPVDYGLKHWNDDVFE